MLVITKNLRMGSCRCIIASPSKIPGEVKLKQSTSHTKFHPLHDCSIMAFLVANNNQQKYFFPLQYARWTADYVLSTHTISNSCIQRQKYFVCEHKCFQNAEGHSRKKIWTQMHTNVVPIRSTSVRRHRILSFRKNG